MGDGERGVGRQAAGIRTFHLLLPLLLLLLALLLLLLLLALLLLLTLLPLLLLLTLLLHLLLLTLLLLLLLLALLVLPDWACHSMIAEHGELKHESRD